MQNQKVNIKKNLSYFFKSSIKTIKLIDENQINKMVDGIRKLKSKGRIFLLEVVEVLETLLTQLMILENYVTLNVIHRLTILQN